MTERRRYWNEDTQSWEDSSDRGRTPTATPPSSLGPGLSPPRRSSRRPGALRSPAARPPTSARPGGSGRRVLWAVIATAVIAVAVVTPVLLESSGGEKSNRAASSATPSASRPAAPGSSAPPADALPDGYRLVTDDKGFSTAVPKGWGRVPTEGQTEAEAFEVDYDAPGGTRFLRVSEVSESTPEQSFEETRQREGFKALAKPEPFTWMHASGQSMEYLIGDSGEEPWYVVDIRFKAADGNLYGVAAYGGDDDLTDERTVAEAALRHFCPPRMTCGDITGAP